MKEAIDNMTIGGMKLPKLKGKTTIILQDVKTGKIDKIEKENMVTNAVARIWANNFCNTLSPSDKRILPIKNMFGGVMCFGQTLNEDANNIFPPDEGTNPLIAHAGDFAELTSPNPKLGMLDVQSSGEITNGYKWQWFFGQPQGVGTINACCLTSALGGNIGLTPVDDTYRHTLIPSMQTVATGQNSGFPTINNIIYTPIKYDRSTNRATAVYAEGTTFTEIVLEQHMFRFGINSAPVLHSEDETTEQGIVKNRYAWREISRRTATLTFSAGNDHAIITDGTDYWILQRYKPSGQNDYYIQINKITTGGTDLVVTTLADIGGNNITMLPFYTTNSSYTRRFTGKYGMIPVRTEGQHKWAYLPKNDLTTFFKIDLNNLADISTLTSRVETGYEVKCWNPAYWAGNICCGYNFIINNDTVYPAAIPEGTTASPETYGYAPIAFADTPSILMPSKYTKTGDTTHYGYINTGIFAPYLATINNLEAPVTKTLSQTMTIIYELKEV